MDDLENAAVKAALAGNWLEAQKLNLQILKKDKKNVRSLNRLARTYLELGKKNLAKQTLASVLKVDPCNQIAQKLKGRLFSKTPKSLNSPKSLICPTSFVEEPGITQTVSLINLAPQKTLGELEYAQEVCLNPKHHSVHVCTDNKYLGALPDDLGKRLYILLKNGRQYCAFVKSTENHRRSLVIFIRETCRGKRYKSIPSFPQKYDVTQKIEETETLPAEEEISPSIHQDEEPEEGP